jgi:DNA polymerase-1
MQVVSYLAGLTPAAVEEKYGVPPHRYPELAALVGEASDNLPGVPGVGPKTAAKWIQTHDGLDNLITHVDKVGGKAGENLRAHLTDVIRNRRLNALVCDLPLSVGPADFARAEWDRTTALELLDELEFRGELRTRLLDVVGAADQPVEADSGFTLEGRVLAPEEVAGFLAELGNEPVGLQVRGSWGSGTGRAEGLALATVDDRAAYVDVAGLTPEADAALAAWLADADRPKVLHDAKGPGHALAAQGWTLAGLATDTAVAAYLVQPDQRSYDLGDLTLRYLKRELRQEAAPEQDALFDDAFLEGEGAVDSAATTAMLQARAVLDLAVVLTAEVEDHGGTRLMADVELPLIANLAAMERTGIAVDVEHLEGLEADFGVEVRAAMEEAFAVIGKEINLGSPKQLQVVLFDELGMPKTKKTKTGWTTDADALQGLFEKTEHPFLLHLLRHRDVTRLRQTVEGLLKTVQPDGRIHTTFNQLIEAFRSGHDFHSITASKVFEVPADEVTGEQRAKIKAMNYGLAYGLSAFGLSQQLKITPAEARVLMDEYFETFGGIRDYLGGIVDEARRSGYTETIMGRRRYLPDLTSDNRQRREMAERMALNAPIQGSAADLIKVAMLDVDRAIAEAGLRSRMLLQVHDELVLEVAPGETEALTTLVRERMGGAATLAVPLDVSVGTGRSWHDAAH